MPAPGEPPPRAVHPALAARRRARELEALRHIRRADTGLLVSILGQIAFMLAIGALTGPSRHARGIDGEIGSVGFTLFGIWQIVSVYRLSLALGEAHPLRRLGSMFLPFASLSVLIAVHSKAVRRLRRA